SRVSDRVRMLHGFKGMIAEVIEDRGYIGVGGRRLYRVKLASMNGTNVLRRFPRNRSKQSIRNPERSESLSGKRSPAIASHTRPRTVRPSLTSPRGKVGDFRAFSAP